MMETHKDKVTVIIRSIGERTEQLCRELILAQGVPEENMVIVREAPFSVTMRKSFEIGIERGLPWTFCIDADVLLRLGAVAKMITLAEQQKDNVCEIQGYVLDKFYGGPRTAGNHLYRTSLLPKVIKQIPPDGYNIRPETHTLEVMQVSGHPWVIVPYIIGLHDFEQYFQDIFRKCFVHAHKHQHHFDLFLSVWRTGAPCDPDFQVALMGLAAGIQHFKEVYIDITSKVYYTFSKSQEYDEKDEILNSDHYSLDDIEKIIIDWIEPPAYQKIFPTKMGLVPRPFEIKSMKTRRVKIQEQLRSLGIIKSIPYVAGLMLSNIGHWLISWVKTNK